MTSKWKKENNKLYHVKNLIISFFNFFYRPTEGGRLYDMKIVSGYAFLRTY